MLFLMMNSAGMALACRVGHSTVLISMRLPTPATGSGNATTGEGEPILSSGCVVADDDEG